MASKYIMNLLNILQTAKKTATKMYGDRFRSAIQSRKLWEKESVRANEREREREEIGYSLHLVWKYFNGFWCTFYLCKYTRFDTNQTNITNRIATAQNMCMSCPQWYRYAHTYKPYAICTVLAMYSAKQCITSCSLYSLPGSINFISNERKKKHTQNNNNNNTTHHFSAFALFVCSVHI